AAARGAAVLRERPPGAGLRVPRAAARPRARRPGLTAGATAPPAGGPLLEPICVATGPGVADMAYGHVRPPVRLAAARPRLRGSRRPGRLRPQAGPAGRPKPPPRGARARAA